MQCSHAVLGVIFVQLWTIFLLCASICFCFRLTSEFADSAAVVAVWHLPSSYFWPRTESALCWVCAQGRMCGMFFCLSQQSRRVCFVLARPVQLSVGHCEADVYRCVQGLRETYRSAALWPVARFATIWLPFPVSCCLKIELSATCIWWVISRLVKPLCSKCTWVICFITFIMLTPAYWPS